jgi:hypothetical protein
LTDSIMENSPTKIPLGSSYSQPRASPKLSEMYEVRLQDVPTHAAIPGRCFGCTDSSFYSGRSPFELFLVPSKILEALPQQIRLLLGLPSSHLAPSPG